MEGFTGSGKSRLSNDLGRDLEATVIQTDEYVAVGDESQPYPDRLAYGLLAIAIASARSTDSLIVVEGICLRYVLQRLSLSADIFVYIKRVARNGLWHDGFHLDDFESGDSIEENSNEPHRSDFAYHVAARPHEHADILFERIEADN